jgi:hypothetical protein
MDINQSEIDQLISQTEALSWNGNPPLLHPRQLPSHLQCNNKSILAEIDAAKQNPPSPENLDREARLQGALQEQLRRGKFYFHASMVIRRRHNSISFIESP